MPPTLARRRPTIAEVALAAGVSQATVSKSLNAPPGGCVVSPETRRRVQEAAERLGYQAGWLASALNRGATGLVALLYSRSTPPMMGQNYEIVHGLHQALEAAELELVLQRVQEDSARSVNLLERGRYDGVVAFESVPGACQPLLASGRLPAVLLNALGPAGVPSVWPDDHQAARLALAHLAALGHRRLVFWHGHFQDPHPSAARRAEGFLAAAAGMGVQAAELVAEAGDLAGDIQSGRQPATAVVCFHELIAARLLRACWDRGLSVPRRLSVLTFNDSYIGQFTAPGLSAVAMPAAALGERAAALLLARMRGGEPPSELVPVTAVVEHGSTGPAPH